jgi:hypothetical protein
MLDPRQMRCSAVQLGRLSLQQGSNEGGAFRQLLRTGFLRDADIQRAAVSGANAQYHAISAGHKIKRGNGGGGNRRHARSKVGHAQSNARLDRMLRQQGGGHPGIHRVTRRICDTNHVVFMALGGRRKPFYQVDIERPEEESDFHDVVSV